MKEKKTGNHREENRATRRGVATIGAIDGFISIEHGFFEILQGNTPTDGVEIEAIGAAFRFEGGVGETT